MISKYWLHLRCATDDIEGLVISPVCNVTIRNVMALRKAALKPLNADRSPFSSRKVRLNYHEKFAE